jgi:predicted permease
MVLSYILERLLPLYFLILLGYLTGKLLKISRETIATLLIYVVVPGVVLHGILHTKLYANLLSLPLLFFVLCTVLSLGSYYLYGKVVKSPTKNILAFAAGTANTGYFGLPVVTMLLGEQVLGKVVFALIGFIFFEYTIGFFVTARGNYSVNDSFKRVLKLPVVYAATLGIILNVCGYNPGEAITQLGASFRGAYSILGMMMIGIAVAGNFKVGMDFKFMGLAFVSKFLVWPAAVLLIIKLDSLFFGFYDPIFYKVMILMSVLPLAANMAAIATLLKAEPEKSATAVLISTAAAAVFIPLAIWLFFPA